MCGIIGAVAQRNVVPILMEGLRRLEYRGYDSAGIAVVNGGLSRIRSTGRVAELAALSKDLKGNLGIAHTRWATHGAPTERNAHPHASRDEIAVVHNGIIENHVELRRKLEGLGYRFESDTDTEVIVHLIHHHYQESGELLEATRSSVKELDGAYAIAVVSGNLRDRLVCARKGSPLLIGLGIEENFIASDASALLPVTRKMIYLEDGDVADIGLFEYKIYDGEGIPVERAVHISELSAETTELGKYRHFMQKEIFEQPKAVADTMDIAINETGISPELFGPDGKLVLEDVEAVTIIACGTSYHAGLVARYWMESLAGIPCSAEVASEYRYRDIVPNPKALIVTISQSGETADTLAALNYAVSLGQTKTLSICNVDESALVRQSKLRFLTRAGPEIGVASTKAFTTQLVALFLLTLTLAKLKGRLAAEQEAGHIESLRRLPHAINHALEIEPKIEQWAEKFSEKQHALFLARGIHYPIALEGALKLKEISYIHAEAYPAGELKHGPLALVDSNMPVVAVAPSDALLEKLKSNLQEVRARGGELYVVSDEESHFQDEASIHVIRMAGHAGHLSPILHAIPMQLLAYHAALQKGTDVDKPRNLAKSVTVE
ncbi:MAG: glutamine--fructose-6-phosphate transaminase (isomerizing) [Burkholderiales bacterium]